MYIINNRGCIFNTECISEITTDGVHVFAVTGATTHPISYNVDALKTIANALKNNIPLVEVD